MASAARLLLALARIPSGIGNAVAGVSPRRGPGSSRTRTGMASVRVDRVHTRGTCDAPLASCCSRGCGLGLGDWCCFVALPGFGAGPGGMMGLEWSSYLVSYY